MKKKAEEQREMSQSGKGSKVIVSPKEVVKEVPKPVTPSNEKEIKRIEKEISDLEARIEEMNLVLADIDYTDESKAQKVLNEYDDLKNQLDAKVLFWERLLD